MKPSLLHRPLSTTAEIERKFIYNDTILQYCKTHATSTREIHMSDVYFDNAQLDLTTRDMWLRQRNDTLELKWPMLLDPAIADKGKNSEAKSLTGLDFYQESTDLSKISNILLATAAVAVQFPASSKGISEVHSALFDAGVLPFGTVLTHRTRYNLCIDLPAQLKGSGSSTIKLFVDIDSVKYILPTQTSAEAPATAVTMEAARDAPADYQIGEVEFNFGEATDTTNSGDAPDAAGADQAGSEAIMSHVFRVIGIQPAPVRGKVLEFLARYRPQHYEALRRCGQLASKGLS
jgi:hypothetical protein